MLGAELYSDMDCENKCHSHFHDTVGQSDEQHHHHHDYHHILHHHHSQNHHPHTHTHSYSLQHFQQAGVATLAWMVIMGDGLHNFSDGLAIGTFYTHIEQMKQNNSLCIVSNKQPWNKLISAPLNCLFFFLYIHKSHKGFHNSLISREKDFYFNFTFYFVTFTFKNIIYFQKI